MEDDFELSDAGQIINLHEETQSFEAVLQASLVLPFHAAYYLLDNLEQSGVKASFWARSRAVFKAAEDDEDK